MAIESLGSSKNLLNEQQVGHTSQYNGTGLFDANGHAIPPDAPGVSTYRYPQEKGAVDAYLRGERDIAKAGFDAAAQIKGE